MKVFVVLWVRIFFLSAGLVATSVAQEESFSFSQSKSKILEQLEKDPIAGINTLLLTELDKVPVARREDYLSSLVVEASRRKPFSKEVAIEIISGKHALRAGEHKQYLPYVYFMASSGLNVWKKETEFPYIQKAWESLLESTDLDRDEVMYVLRWGIRLTNGYHQPIRDLSYRVLSDYLKNGGSVQNYSFRYALSLILYYTPTSDNERLIPFYEVFAPSVEKVLLSGNVRPMSDPDLHALLARLTARTQSEDGMLGFIETYREELKGDLSVFKALVESSKYKSALQLIPDYQSVFYNSSYSSIRYTKDLHQQLPNFMPLVLDPVDEQYVRIILTSLPNAYNPRWPKDTEGDRIDAVLKTVDATLLGSYERHLDLLGIFYNKPTARLLLKETYIDLTAETDCDAMFQKNIDLLSDRDSSEQEQLAHHRMMNSVMAGARIAYQFGDPSLMHKLVTAGERVYKDHLSASRLSTYSPWIVWATSQFVQTVPPTEVLDESIEMVHRVLAMVLEQRKSESWTGYSTQIIASAHLLHATRYGSMDVLKEYLATLPKNVQKRYADIAKRRAGWKQFSHSYTKGRNYWSWKYNDDNRKGFIFYIYGNEHITEELIGDSSHRGFRQGMKQRMFQPQDLEELFDILPIDDARLSCFLAITASELALGKKKEPALYHEQARGLMQRALNVLETLDDPAVEAEVTLFHGVYLANTGHREEARKVLDEVILENLMTDESRAEWQLNRGKL